MERPVGGASYGHEYAGEHALSVIIHVVAHAVQGNCLNPEWQASCDQVQNCRFNNSQAAGCEKSGANCTDCARGFDNPLPEEGGNRVAGPIPFDESKQWIGYFSRERTPRFVVTVPGALRRIGVEPGMVISRVNGWRLTRRRMMNLARRKYAPMRITFYAPGQYSRSLTTATLRPAGK
jgi:hypothetical protein